MVGFSWFAPDGDPGTHAAAGADTAAGPMAGGPAPADGPTPTGGAAPTGGPGQLAAVVFDWGGTLTPFHDVDLLDLWRLAALEISPPQADEITAILAGLEASWWHSRDAAGGHAGNGSEGGMTGSIAELLAAASARLGVDVAAAVVQAASRRDLTAWTPHTMCDPEALLLVHLVRARGLLIGLLTNTRWPRLWHERMLQRDGLLDLFHARIYTSDLPFDKPHPIAFQAVLDALGISDPSRVLFVGDRVRTDIRGARAAGMRTVLVRDGGSGAVNPGMVGHTGQLPADAVIGRLGQLLEVLDAFGAARPGTPPPR